MRPQVHAFAVGAFLAASLTTVVLASPAAAALKNEIIFPTLDAGHPPLINTYPSDKVQIAGQNPDIEVSKRRHHLPADRDAAQSRPGATAD
jgi:hypothetical protein